MVIPAGRTMAAAQSAAWSNRMRNPEGPYAPTREHGASVTGFPFLPGILDPNARIIVEFAPGADLTASPDSWSWIDITADVMQANNGTVSISPMGRSDETQQAQPSQCAFTLSNISQNYLNTPQSTYYPNIKRNTPVRVSVSAGYGYDVRFQGYIVGFPPAWDTTGTFPTVAVTAFGILQRLSNKSAPALSALRRTIQSNPYVKAYWPVEDGASSTRAAEVISNYAGGATIEPPFGFGDAEPAELYSSNALAVPHLSAVSRISSMGSSVPAFPVTWSPANDGWSVSWFMNIPQVPSTVETILIELFTADLPVAWNLRCVLGTDGKIRIKAFNASGVDEFADIGVTFDQFTTNGSVYGRWVQFSFYCVTDSTPTSTLYCTWEDEEELFYDWEFYGVSSPDGYHSISSQPTQFRVSGASFQADEFGFGHLAILDTAPRIDFTYEGFGYKEEDAITRLERICTEEGIPLTVINDGDYQPNPMGPQSTAKTIDNLHEIESTDGGLLIDGRGPGITFITRAARQSKRATITVDASLHQIDEPFEPEDDDQRNRNSVEIQNRNASNVTYTDSTGPQGTNAIGEYPSSVSVNLFDDTNTLFRAAWEVRRGTVGGLRYPTLSLDFAANPELALQWLASEVNNRLDALNVSLVAQGHPPGTIDLLIEGWSEILSPTQWAAVLNCSPYDPYIVGKIQTADVFAWRLDTGNTTVDADYAAGSTTIGINVNDGFLWSTVVTDYPIDVGINGIQVTVTGCTGAGSPQSLTVQPLPYAIKQGWSVSLWNVPRLAL